MDDEEPDDLRVLKDLKLIDVDQSGTIDRLEWIEYIASPEEDGFDFNLKELFDNHDTSKAGYISLD